MGRVLEKLKKSIESIAIYVLEIMYLILTPDKVNQNVSHLALGISQKWKKPIRNFFLPLPLFSGKNPKQLSIPCILYATKSSAK